MLLLFGRGHPRASTQLGVCLCVLCVRSSEGFPLTHILSPVKVVNTCGVFRWGLEFCGVLLLFPFSLFVLLLLLLADPPAGETCFLSQWKMFP